MYCNGEAFAALTAEGILPMPSPLSVDLRERVVAAVSEGASCHVAAARFAISASSVSRWSTRFRDDGVVGPKPSGGNKGCQGIEAHSAQVLALCKQQPTLFLHEVRDQLAEQGITTSTSSLSRFFARHGITRKKGIFTQPSSSART